jgi:hypothetical protein
VLFFTQSSSTEMRVMWSHEFRHAGDHPEWDRIPALVAANRFASG